MTEPTLKDKVEELIGDNQILLFMKGTPDAPQCGFSMRVVNVLESYGVEYAALDVLPALQPLREVTAEISDWQTFPQLYVNGKLVGGCDIVEELDESGELAEVLGAQRAEPAPPSAAATLGLLTEKPAPCRPSTQSTSEPKTNCMLVLSTTTATPWLSKRWSSSLGVSKASAYWNPEQPPPRTATRSACSAPFSCSPRSSLILVAALSVSVIG